MADIDEVQNLGETALTTLTQLWRQLPRVNAEASKQLGDQVVSARKAIERLVRIGCEAHIAPSSLGDSAKMYEPLPFGTNTHQRHHNHHGGGQPGRTSPSRSDSSLSGSPAQRRRPSYPDGADEAAAEAAASANSSTSARRIHGSGNNNADDSSASPKHPPLDEHVAEAALIADFQRFEQELKLPAHSSFYEDPAWAGLLRGYVSTRSHLPPSRLALMVQLAQRREYMWRLHARQLQWQGDRDALAQLETTARCDLAVEAAEAREVVLARAQGVKLEIDPENVALASLPNSSLSQSPARRPAAAIGGADGGGGGHARIFDNITQALAIEKEKREIEARHAQLDEEKRQMLAEVERLTVQAGALARDNTALTQRAASPPKALTPLQLAELQAEIAALRQQVSEQEQELLSLGDGDGDAA